MSSSATHPLPDICDHVLYTQETIAERLSLLGQQISQEYAQVLEKGEELVVVAVLKGSYMFAADLTRHISVPNSIDFLAVSSYGKGAVSSGEVRIVMDLRCSIAGKHVLIVEDIIDSGMTLAFLQMMLKTRKPASLKTVVLLKKKPQVEAPVEFFAFDASDVKTFVVGYGLDFAEMYRNLPYIAGMKMSIVEELKKK